MGQAKLRGSFEQRQREAIAAQVAAFQRKGGKVQTLTHGEVARNPTSMQAIHDENWRKSAERTKAAGVGSVNIKRKRGPDLRLGKGKRVRA